MVRHDLPGLFFACFFAEINLTHTKSFWDENNSTIGSITAIAKEMKRPIIGAALSTNVCPNQL
jgi:hypothetical protein